MIRKYTSDNCNLGFKRETSEQCEVFSTLPCVYVFFHLEAGPQNTQFKSKPVGIYWVLITSSATTNNNNNKNPPLVKITMNQKVNPENINCLVYLHMHLLRMVGSRFNFLLLDRRNWKVCKSNWIVSIICETVRRY